MLTAKRIQLLPNLKTKCWFAQASGTAWVIWNWSLREWKKQYAAGWRPNSNDLDKLFNKIKQEEYPWMFDDQGNLVVNNCIGQRVILKNLKQAWKSYFDDLKDKSKPKSLKHNKPKEKKRRKRDSFYLSNTAIKVAPGENRVWLGKAGWVRTTAPVPKHNKLLGGTVNRRADKWFLSVQIEVDDPPLKYKDEESIVGVDVGINSMAALSNGRKIEAPKPLKAALKKMRRLQRRMPKRPGDGQKNGVKVRLTAGSRNHIKAKKKLAKMHYRIACIRENALHQATSSIVKNHGHIAIENLNVKGMTKNKRIARPINDVGFYEFRRQIEYKAARAGAKVTVADRWFPSSKTCSSCGAKKKELKLKDRTFTCDECGFVLDRDENAAINLAVFAEGCP